MIKSIHFGGGAFSIIGYIGVLNYFEKNQCIMKTLKLSGTSTGAIFAFLICIGLNSYDMIRIFTPDVLKVLININKMIDFEKNGNLVNYDELWLKLRDICYEKNYNLDTLTFQELFEATGRNLIINGTCIQNSECEFFNHVMYPDMEIIKALEITTCIPLLLKPINYNGKFYVDGAISDNYIFRDCDVIVGNNIDFNRNFLFDQRFDLIDYTKNILIALISIITNIRYKSENCIVITSESFLPYFDNNSLFRMILDGYEKT